MMSAKGLQTVLIVISKQTSKGLIKMNVDNVDLKVFPIKSL